MDIPVISRMNDFEASITSLSSNSSPSLISRLISIFQLQTRLLLWKWTPLLLALIYAFGTVARRVRILISHRRLRRRTATTKQLHDTLQPLFQDEDEDDDDEDAVSSSSDDEEDDERTASSSSSTSPRGDENGWDFRVAGSDFRDQSRKFNIRRRRSLTTTGADNLFSLADFVNGKSVVKLWDNFGLELDIDTSPPSSPFSDSSSTPTARSFSILDLERDVAVGSVLGEVSMMSSPAVVLTARTGDGTVGLSSWDMRLRRRKPAVEVEWRWTADASGRPLGINAGGVDKVYVRGGGGGDLAAEAIADLRNPVAPLDNVTEFDGDDTWWDAHSHAHAHAHAVIQTDG